MSERGIQSFLQDILQAAGRIQSYTEGMDFPALQKDFKTQDAVFRNLEIIGEAAKNIPEEFRATHPDIPWKGMAGLRDRLIHAYFGVNLDIVWDVVRHELPTVVKQIEKLV